MLAIILALGIWVIVMSNNEGVHEFNKQIPVRLFNLAAEMVVTNETELKPIKIFLQGPKEKFKDLKLEDFNAYVDLSGLRPGEHNVLVQVAIDKQRQVQVARVEPSQLNLLLEPKITKTLPVVVMTEGKVSSDFTFKLPVAVITSAKVTGGRSLVNQAVEAVALLKFTGEEESDVQKSLPLVARGDQGKMLASLEIVPTTVEVNAVLERVSHSKTVGVQAKLSKESLAEGYWLKNVEVEPATVTVRGDPASLKRIDFIATQEVKIGGLNQNLNKWVLLELPTGVELSNNASSGVTVRVKVATTSTKRTIFASILTENLSELKVEKLEPASIKVELEGSLEAINGLKESDIFFNLDLAGKKEGSQELVLKSSNLTLPQGIKLISFTPDKLTITLIKLVSEESPKQDENKKEAVDKEKTKETTA